VDGFENKNYNDKNKNISQTSTKIVPYLHREHYYVYIFYRIDSCLIMSLNVGKKTFNLNSYYNCRFCICNRLVAKLLQKKTIKPQLPNKEFFFPSYFLRELQLFYVSITMNRHFGLI
jgi:hypothetical protein